MRVTQISVTVIPAKAGIQNKILGPRLRGDDELLSLGYQILNK